MYVCAWGLGVILRLVLGQWLMCMWVLSAIREELFGYKVEQLSSEGCLSYGGYQSLRMLSKMVF